MRARNGVAWLVSALRSLLEEVLCVVGCVLAVWALWPTVGRLALLIPAGVLLWIALPARSWFMTPVSERKDG